MKIKRIKEMLNQALEKRGEKLDRVLSSKRAALEEAVMAKMSMGRNTIFRFWMQMTVQRSGMVWKKISSSVQEELGKCKGKVD